jgi:hypothetical protein
MAGIELWPPKTGYIASDRRECGDLSCSMERRDCFVVSLLAMTTLWTFLGILGQGVALSSDSVTSYFVTY